MATVYIGPLGSTQKVQGGGGGGGALKTIFSQSPPVATLYAGTMVPHSLFGVVPFVLGVGASDFCVDVVATFSCNVATVADSQFIVRGDLDGVPGSFVSLQGSTIPIGGGVRIASAVGVACLPPIFVPPGPHTIEWFVITPVDLTTLTGDSAFAMFRAFWTE